MSILSFDLSSFDLKPIDQLVFIRLGDLILSGVPVSASCLCEICNCTKPTIYSSLAKLSFLGLIEVNRFPGQLSSYSLGYECFILNTPDPFAVEDTQNTINLPLSSHSKNRNKRKRKKRK